MAPGAPEDSPGGNVPTQQSWAVHTGVHLGTPGIAATPTLGLYLQKSQQQWWHLGSEGGGKAERKAPEAAVSGGAHDTGLGHRSGEGAEVRLSGSRWRGALLREGLRDRNQKLGGYLLFEGDT